MKINRFILCLGALFLTLTLASCEQEAKELSASENDKVSNASEKLDKFANDSVVITMKDTPIPSAKSFKSMVDGSKDIPYLKIGDTIKVEFLEGTPTSVKLFDEVMKSTGVPQYNPETANIIDLPLKGDFAEIVVTEHFAVSLSSHTDDYEDGNVYRGYTLVYDIEGTEQTVYFMIRTSIRA